MPLLYHGNVIAGDEIPRTSLKVWLDPGVYECYPGSGTTAYDLSGNGNNGTMTYHQLCTLVPGVFEFQGTYTMNIPNLGSDFGQNDFSMCIWVNVDVYDDGALLLCGHTNHSYGFDWVDSGEEVRFGCRDSDSSHIANLTGLQTNEWMFFAGVHNSGTDVRLYVADSTQGYDSPSMIEATDSTGLSALSPSADLIVGGTYRLGGSYGDEFDGSVGSILVYEKELSADEVNQIYQVQRARYDV